MAVAAAVLALAVVAVAAVVAPVVVVVVALAVAAVVALAAATIVALAVAVVDVKVEDGVEVVLAILEEAVLEAQFGRRFPQAALSISTKFRGLQVIFLCEALATC